MYTTLIVGAVLIVGWGLIASGQAKEPAAPDLPKPKMPMAKAYAEMIGIIADATDYRQLRCINALLIDFQVTYWREPKEEVQELVKHVISEKKKKVAEIIEANQPHLIFS